MKKPTTEYAIDVQDRVTINRSFIESKGWILDKEYPLYESFKHKKDNDIICEIGLYGSFSLGKMHWLNRDIDTLFSVRNPDLTEEDYDTIIRLTKLKL